MTKRTLRVDLPPGWRELRDDGPGHAYSPLGEHRGILRLSLQPHRAGRLPDDDAVRAEFQMLCDQAGLAVGETITDIVFHAPAGPGMLRLGRHPQYGLVAVAFVFAEVAVLATYDMGSPDHVDEEVRQVWKILAGLRFERRWWPWGR